MKNSPLPRLDTSAEVREQLLPYCRLKLGDFWEDPVHGHRVACIDSTDSTSVQRLASDATIHLAVQDPPYNLAAFETRSIPEFIKWCDGWLDCTTRLLAKDSSLYVWLGADQTEGFQPLADFILMMRQKPFQSRSLITMRNQRGYGTQKNWMAVRQELLYYTKGSPTFNVEAEYTDIPKILRGYYKQVSGVNTENIERSNSDCIRAGNVWVDIQQIFYRLEENVSGCYAQKPIKSIERIIRASSNPKERVLDLFSHSGTTLMACELLGRTCYTADIDPVYAEITIRRLEHYRRTGRLGWQNGNAFESEVADKHLGVESDEQFENPDSQRVLF